MIPPCPLHFYIEMNYSKVFLHFSGLIRFYQGTGVFFYDKGFLISPPCPYEERIFVNLSYVDAVRYSAWRIPSTSRTSVLADVLKAFIILTGWKKNLKRMENQIWRLSATLSTSYADINSIPCAL